MIVPRLRRSVWSFWGAIVPMPDARTDVRQSEYRPYGSLRHWTKVATSLLGDPVARANHPPDSPGENDVMSSARAMERAGDYPRASVDGFCQQMTNTSTSLHSWEPTPSEQKMVESRWRGNASDRTI